MATDSRGLPLCRACGGTGYETSDALAAKEAELAEARINERSIAKRSEDWQRRAEDARAQLSEAVEALKSVVREMLDYEDNAAFEIASATLAKLTAQEDSK